MTVTFNLHTAEDYDWLIHVLKGFQTKNLNIQINDDTGLDQTKKRKQFLDYFANHPIREFVINKLPKFLRIISNNCEARRRNIA